MNMNRFKKVIIPFGAAGTIVAPIATLIACSGGSSSDHALVILAGKSQINELGKTFAKTFDNSKLFKDSNVQNKGGPKNTHFITKNGNNLYTYLATTYGTKKFPAAFTLDTATDAQTYLDKGAVLGFQDPEYDSNGNATNQDAIAYNTNLAGQHINDLIKFLQMNGRSTQLMKYRGKIIGIPSYVESIGTIYNKDIFREANVTIRIGVREDGTKPNWTTQTKDNEAIVYTGDLITTVYYNAMLKYVVENSSASYTKGITLSGKESWAFTSKVTGSALSAAAITASLKNIGATVAGEDYEENILTPNSAYEKLFKNANSPGVEAVAEAAQFYLKGSTIKHDYITNGAMMDAFIAGHLATIPQGSWMEGVLNKVKKTNYYGFLPMPIKGMYGKIAIDAVGFWMFADQVKSNGRSQKAAKAFATQAINFIYSQYMTDKGKKMLNKDMGLVNPYSLANDFGDSIHPLLSDQSEYAAQNLAIRWGLAFNKPGGGQHGFERDNVSWTNILQEYADGTKNIDDVKNKVVDIWAE